MDKEELKTATNEELIDELDYCGYDSYYDKYRADIVAEIKRRMKKASALDKAKETIEKHIQITQEIDPHGLMKDCLYIINRCETESEEER